MNPGYSMCSCAARANEQGEGLPPGAPCGVACGQALQPCGLSGGLTTGSRLRRACTPFLMEKFHSTGKQITIRALSRAHSPGCRSTYLSGNAVQTNRATSDVGVDAACLVAPMQAGWPVQHKVDVIAVTDVKARLAGLTRRQPPTEGTARYQYQRPHVQPWARRCPLIADNPA